MQGDIRTWYLPSPNGTWRISGNSLPWILPLTMVITQGGACDLETQLALSTGAGAGHSELPAPTLCLDLGAPRSPQ